MAPRDVNPADSYPLGFTFASHGMKGVNRQSKFPSSFDTHCLLTDTWGGKYWHASVSTCQRFALMALFLARWHT